MSLITNFKDRVPTEVLANGAVRYEQFSSNGTSQGYVYMKRADEPTEAGNAWNKAVYDGIKNEFGDVLYIASKATQAEAEAGVDDIKYMTALKTLYAIKANAVSTQVSIKTGTVSSGDKIPKTNGYNNYIYFVSPNTIINQNLHMTTVAEIKIVCEVNQSTRTVTVGSYGRKGTSSWSDWNGGVANYLELAWN